MPAALNKLLFLHPNFPAQFKHQCKNAAIHGFDVKFLCNTHYGRTIEGVKKLVIKKKVVNDNGGNSLQDFNVNDQVQIGIGYRSAFENLALQGWNPNYVISHSGWGCGTYVKAIWPKCKLISYVEWWFDPNSDFYSFDAMNEDLNVNKKTAINNWCKNQSIAVELATADKIIAPTEWQREQLPENFKKNTYVVNDGFDIAKITSGNMIKSTLPLVTYGTRGMEPIRAFKQFILEIPEILKINDNITIEIAGRDEQNYGGRSPKGFKSWGDWAKNYLIENKVAEKVKWLNYLNERDYYNWLKRSWCHIYLTHPYVLSWSFLEAYICKCPIVCSKVKPVMEFTNKSCIFIDHRTQGSLCYGVRTILQDEQRWIRAANRNIEKFDQKTSFKRLVDVTGLQLAT